MSVYKVDTWQPVAELHHKDEEKESFQVRSVVFSSDGHTLRVFDVRLATELIRVPLT